MHSLYFFTRLILHLNFYFKEIYRCRFNYEKKKQELIQFLAKSSFNASHDHVDDFEQAIVVVVEELRKLANSFHLLSGL